MHPSWGEMITVLSQLLTKHRTGGQFPSTHPSSLGGLIWTFKNIIHFNVNQIRIRPVRDQDSDDQPCALEPIQ